MKVTDAKLNALSGTKHDKAPIKYADRDGLTIYHRRTGTLSFVMRYRYQGKPQDLALGSYPMMSLKEARIEVTKWRKVLEKGLDPKVEKKLELTKALDAITVEQALEYWIQKYAKNKRANYEKHQQQFRRHIYPFIGHLPVERCETRHWVKVFDDITEGTHYRPAPKACGYILQNCKQALKFCRVRNYVESRALDDLSVDSVGETQERGERVLSWGELMDVWKWTHDPSSNWYYRNLIYLLIVFGCRTQEIRLSRASDWDLESRIWTTPKDLSKTGVTIQRPIPDCVVERISSLKALSQTPYLLNEPKKGPAVSVWGSNLYKKLGHKEPWTLHDLRRTFDTMMNEMDVNPIGIIGLMGHSRKGTDKIYNLSQKLDLKSECLDIWLETLKNGTNPLG